MDVRPIYANTNDTALAPLIITLPNFHWKKIAIIRWSSFQPPGHIWTKYSSKPVRARQQKQSRCTYLGNPNIALNTLLHCCDSFRLLSIIDSETRRIYYGQTGRLKERNFDLIKTLRSSGLNLQSVEWALIKCFLYAMIWGSV